MVGGGSGGASRSTRARKVKGGLQKQRKGSVMLEDHAARRARQSEKGRFNCPGSDWWLEPLSSATLSPWATATTQAEAAA